jgi:nucleotide-binding universal stress UspA family protein
MAGVVVGVSRTGRSVKACQSGSALRWACTEAALRDLPLTLVHAWDEPLDLSIELAAGTSPDITVAATSYAARGDAPSVLLAQQPDLLVLGGREGTPRLSGIARSCVHRAWFPVVIVPATRPPPTGRVVVGLNGSAASGAALTWAAREARLRLAHLVVVHIWQLHPRSTAQVLRPSRAMPGQQHAALDRLHSWVQQLLGPIDVELHALHGGPLDGLLDVSADAELLVLGHGAHSGVSQLLHGAVSDDLSALIPCPVAVIPAPATAAAL